MRGYSNFLKFPFRFHHCHAGLEMLAGQIKLASGQEENPFQVDPDEITEAAPQELIVDEDEEGDSDIDID